MTVITTKAAFDIFKPRLKSILSSIKDEAVNIFGAGLQEYVNVSRSNTLNAKTFLFTEKKIKFYDTYFSLSVKVNNKGKIKISSDIEPFFKNGNVVGLLGIAGGGKTMLMKHIFLQSLNKMEKIPIFIELRSFNYDGRGLLEYLYDIVLKRKIKPNVKILERALESGAFIFLFDGYDELNSKSRNIITQDLELFTSIYRSNQFVFTSRPGAYLESFPNIDLFQVESLSKSQVFEFVEKQAALMNDIKLGEMVKKTIESDKKSSYISYLQNPLLLSMFLLTYRNYPELPKSKYKFYFNVIDTLFTRHDSKKGAGYFHEKKCKLLNDEINNILESFCFLTLVDQRFSFDLQYIYQLFDAIKAQNKSLRFDNNHLLYDLEVTLSILIKEGEFYKFPHRTIQDYFAALFIKNLSSELKPDLYQTTLPYILRVGRDNINFADLIYEVDKNSLYNLYLKSIFEKYESLKDKKITYQTLLQFIKVTQTRVAISIREDKVVGYGYRMDRESNLDFIIFDGRPPQDNNSPFSMLFDIDNIYEDKIYSYFTASDNKDEDVPASSGAISCRIKFYELSLSDFKSLMSLCPDVYEDFIESYNRVMALIIKVNNEHLNEQTSMSGITNYASLLSKSKNKQ